MIRITVLAAALSLLSSAACAQTPAAPDAPAAPGPIAKPINLKGQFTQGGLVYGQIEPGATLKINGEAVKVDEAGRFAAGFERDYEGDATFEVRTASGSVFSETLPIAPRAFSVERIDGLPPGKVNPYSEDQLAHIRRDQAKKKDARATTQPGAHFFQQFIWPVTGRQSGSWGSQRILNGEPKRPHFGVDIAAPTGTPVKAPASGIVTLAEPDMYFEGGLIFLDHGLGVTSLFMHLSRLDVKPGDRIEQGDIVGAVGSTGRSTGPHLHWGLWWNGINLDPSLLVGEMPAD